MNKTPVFIFPSMLFPGIIFESMKQTPSKILFFLPPSQYADVTFKHGYIFLSYFFNQFHFVLKLKTNVDWRLNPYDATLNHRFKIKNVGWRSRPNNETFHHK